MHTVRILIATATAALALTASPTAEAAPVVNGVEVRTKASRCTVNGNTVARLRVVNTATERRTVNIKYGRGVGAIAAVRIDPHGKVWERFLLYPGESMLVTYRSGGEVVRRVVVEATC